ncbi:MAG: hypothetical protein ACXWJH_01505, partial [Hyphomicrobium sp.]
APCPASWQEPAAAERKPECTGQSFERLDLQPINCKQNDLAGLAVQDASGLINDSTLPRARVSDQDK